MVQVADRGEQSKTVRAARLGHAGCSGRTMSDQEQLDLLQPTLWQRGEAWRHTPAGGEISNRFMRLAIGLRRRGFKHFGAKAIVERLRFHYALKLGPDDGDYRINNNYTAYLARWAMMRNPELQDFFETRRLGVERRPKKRITVEVFE